MAREQSLKIQTLPENLQGQFDDPTSLLTGEARQMLPDEMLQPLLDAFSQSITAIFIVGLGAALIGFLLSLRIESVKTKNG